MITDTAPQPAAPQTPTDGKPTPPTTAPPPTAPQPTQISRKRLEECRDSAKYWGPRLQLYADVNQRRGDLLSLVAGILAAVTGLSVWPVADSTTTGWAPALVAGGALATSICALIPRIYNFGDRAGQAREIGPLYGQVYGELIDLCDTNPIDQQWAAVVLAEFRDAKTKKDSLRGLPQRYGSTS